MMEINQFFKTCCDMLSLYHLGPSVILDSSCLQFGLTTPSKPISRSFKIKNTSSIPAVFQVCCCIYITLNVIINHKTVQFDSVWCLREIVWKVPFMSLHQKIILLFKKGSPWIGNVLISLKAIQRQ